MNILSLQELSSQHQKSVTQPSRPTSRREKSRTYAPLTRSGIKDPSPPLVSHHPSNTPTHTPTLPIDVGARPPFTPDNPSTHQTPANTTTTGTTNNNKHQQPPNRNHSVSRSSTTHPTTKTKQQPTLFKDDDGVSRNHLNQSTLCRR
ncbi:unnamed protein product [Ixodes persulcatus]